MGKAIADAAAQRSDLAIVGSGADVFVDFSAPDGLEKHLDAALGGEAPIVIGTTGLSPEHHRMIDDAAGRIPVLQAANMSLGVNLLAGLVRKAAATLGEDFDIEVLEMHHRMKVDAPSGTALLLGEAAAEGRKILLKERSVRSRDGHTGARNPGDIGFATLRGGTVVGEHSVIFAGAGERIELAHRAEDRNLFARGAVRAALWGFDKKPGYYTMDHVLGLDRL